MKSALFIYWYFLWSQIFAIGMSKSCLWQDYTKDISCQVYNNVLFTLQLQFSLYILIHSLCLLISPNINFFLFSLLKPFHLFLYSPHLLNIPTPYLKSFCSFSLCPTNLCLMCCMFQHWRYHWSSIRLYLSHGTFDICWLKIL